MVTWKVIHLKTAAEKQTVYIPFCVNLKRFFFHKLKGKTGGKTKDQMQGYFLC